ncbi:MAG: aldo/keto reductase [Christensenellales bacterium]
MKYMKIGNSTVTASVITLGAWSMGGGNWWKNAEDQQSIRTIHYALELGVTTIDTAPIYGCGHSEEIVGKAIAGKRSQYVLSTKATFDWDTGVGRYCYDVDGHKIYIDHSYAAIKKDCENSLRRLGTDYIDIYYLHNPAKDTEEYPVEETVRALLELKQAGKIRAIGLSNVRPEHIEAYRACGCEIDIVQRKYSMLERSVETDILPLCKKYGMSFHAYSPLERGLLTGSVKSDAIVPPGDARDGQPWWKPDKLPLAVQFVQDLHDICVELGCTNTELALAFLLNQGDYINVICGAHKPEQIAADVTAVDVILPANTLAEIRARLVDLENAG